MKKLTPLLLVLLLMASCQKDPDTSKLSGNFLVYTDYDTSENFKDFDTFYIPDSILLITSSKTPSYWNNEQSQELLTTVIDNMTKYGYNQVMDKEFADVGIQVSYIESTYYFTNYSSPYWWWDYPGYWYPGYWGGYWNSWYYPYTVSYNYTTGSLLIEIIKLDTQSKKIPIIWNAYMSGLLYSSNRINLQLDVDAVDQAFEQSSYLNKQN